MLEISIIIFVIEIIALCFFIYARYFSKKIRYTRTIFTTVVFLINFAIYFTAYFYKMSTTGEGYYSLGVVTAIASSVASFLFRPSVSDALPLINAVPFFLYTYVLGFVLSAFTTVFLIIDAFRYRIKNSIRFMRISSRKYDEIDYVIGDGVEEINYAKDYKNTVLLLSSDTPKEKIHSLIDQGFCVYPRLTDTFEIISRMRKKKNKRYVFVMFDDDDQETYIKAIEAFRKGENNDNTYLYLEVNYEKIEYLKTVLLNDEKTKTHVMLFNRYENMTNEMCSNEPLSTYLPSGFVNEDTSIKVEKKINVFLIGFGWANQEIYKKLLINNQFVEQTKEGYKSHLVNYFIYDIDENKKNVYSLDGIESLFAKLEKNKGDYFDLPERLSNTVFKTKNAEIAGILNEFEDISSDKNSMNFFFISHRDDYHNLNLTSLIYDVVKDNNFHIFTRTTELSLCDKNIKNVTYFGDLVKYLVHDKIVNHELYNIGVKVNDAYVGHATSLDDLLKKDFIKINSNYYQAMNIRKKYHLLGYDFVKENDVNSEDQIIEEETFYNRIGVGSIKEYDDYFKHSNLAAAVATEHLHWNAEYFVFGFKPLKIEEHVISGDTVIEQNVTNKLHGALTSIKGLDLRARYILKLYQELGNKDKVLFSLDGNNSIEVFKYDYQFLQSSYKYLRDEGYVIIKKR